MILAGHRQWMPARAHGERQLGVLVVFERRGEETTEPARGSALTGSSIARSRFPVIPGIEVAQVKIRIRRAEDRGELPLVVQFLEAREVRVEPDFVVQLDDLFLLDPSDLAE